MPVEENLTYSRGVLSAEQIQSEIDRFWRELETIPELEAELKVGGFDPVELRELRGESAITLHVATSGVDPISTLFIITFAPAANRVLKDLWTTILLPRIQRRWGDDAIGDESHRRDQ
jgi:hypothetical protein